MNEPFADPQRAAASGADAASPTGAAMTAGAILRAARERQGVHIAMLAAAIKVSPRKLDALEGDRYDELPDATFTRALAQTVCRALKIDVQPVLAKLPAAGTLPLEQVSVGLNTPFRERPGRSDVVTRLPTMPLVWAGVALLAGALALALWPAQGLQGLMGDTSTGATSAVPAASPAPATPSTAASASPAPDMAAAPMPAASVPALPAAVVETVHSAPPPDIALASTPASAQAAARGATLVAADASWVEIVDGSGQTLLSRIVQAGETVNVDGALPMKLKIGNARGTQLVFRGQAVELDAFTRDNVARVELK